MVSIDRSAPVVCVLEIEIGASPDQVWAILTNVAGWVDWMEPITSARLEGPLAPGSIIHWSVAGVDISVAEKDIPSKLVDVEPGRRLAWQGAAAGLTGTHVWEFEPSSTGTKLTNSESIFGAEDPAKDTIELETFLRHWNAQLKATVEQCYGGGDSRRKTGDATELAHHHARPPAIPDDAHQEGESVVDQDNFGALARHYPLLIK